jgi:hypothetical protein
MARVITITDDEGKAIGRFEAPDGATADEIQSHYARYKQQVLARRAQRESERTVPQVAMIMCSICRKPKPARDIGSHVRTEHALGVDKDL